MKSFLIYASVPITKPKVTPFDGELVVLHTVLELTRARNYEG